MVRKDETKKKKGFTLTTVLLAMAATVGLLLILTGCGVNSDKTGVSGQTGGEAPLSDSADMAGTMSGTDASETDLMEELFGAKGVYWQDLANNGEPINTDDKLNFLDMFGFGDSVPFMSIPRRTAMR